MSTQALPNLAEHLRELAPNGIELPAPDLAGGWSEEVKADGKCHYFTQGKPVPNHATLVEFVSLCGRYQGEGRPDELDDLDPLAPENCKECRRLLLKHRGMI